MCGRGIGAADRIVGVRGPEAKRTTGRSAGPKPDLRAPRDAPGRISEGTMGEFRHPALKQLTDQQVRYAPPVKRREQLAAAGRLLGDVDPVRAYPYQFVCFRLTGFRTDAYPDLLIPGADLRQDLRLFIDRL